jgi:large subunit ribosomal protein L10e
VSRNWGFTPYLREDYVALRRDGRLVPDGVGVKPVTNHGPVDARDASRLFAEPLVLPSSVAAQ